jgi:hypothetical protein
VRAFEAFTNLFGALTALERRKITEAIREPRIGSTAGTGHDRRDTVTTGLRGRRLR